MKRNETFTQQTVDFITANEDLELAGRIFAAICKEAINEEGKGDTKKTFCALAKASAMFLGMCSNLTPEDDKMRADEFFDPYTEVLDFYCFAADTDRIMANEDAEDEQEKTTEL